MSLETDPAKGGAMKDQVVADIVVGTIDGIVVGVALFVVFNMWKHW